jgi:hypothetical protein
MSLIIGASLNSRKITHFRPRHTLISLLNCSVNEPKNLFVFPRFPICSNLEAKAVKRLGSEKKMIAAHRSTPSDTAAKHDSRDEASFQSSRTSRIRSRIPNPNSIYVAEISRLVHVIRNSMLVYGVVEES